MKKIAMLLVLILFSCSGENPQEVSNGTVPGISTARISSVTADAAVSGGGVSFDGGSTVVSRGVCWSTAAEPTINDRKTTDIGDSSNFVSNITGLEADTQYFIRAYATNNAGTAYGNTVIFRSHKITPDVVDADGNVYKTIQIGTQLWMKENLKTTRFCNGEEIPNVTGNSWFSSNTPAWSYYNDDPENNVVYGKLYNWFAMRDSRNICPCDWHVPTKEEWGTMIRSLGSEPGNKMKSVTGWGLESEGTNESGFSALPGGARATSFTVINFRFDGVWWVNENSADGRLVNFDTEGIGNVVLDKNLGISVRCIKNQ